MNWFSTTVFNKNFWMSRSSYPRIPSKLTVTVVVPAWNEEKYIEDTIDSILDQTYPCKIIVVDDCSTDRTNELASSFYDVKVLKTDVNQGSKSRALNYAISHVDTDIFICVDADTVLDPDSVAKLLMAFNDKTAMVASGFVKARECGNIWQSGRFGDYVLGQTIVKSAQQNANIVLVASGCFFGIRVPFLKAHMFNERTMAEDMDLTWVAIENGHRVIFVEDAFCTVNDPYNYHTFNNQVSRWYRGFFQGIKVRKYDLFSKNPKLGIIVYTYMLVNMLSMPLLILLPVIMSYTSSSFSIAFFFWLVLCLIMIMWNGWKKGDRVLEYPKHIINLFILSFLVYFIYIRSFIQEIILGNELKTWVKGH